MTYTSSDVIGEVTEVTGEAKIIRADGSEEPIILGTEIFEGDIVETEGAGAVNIGFIDDSEFAVSSDARIAIDEFVFDPASESGAQDFSVMKGVFMYTSGLIGRENPDSVEIDTPVGSIGIRGTIIGGDINPDGESQVTVIEGAIVVRNDGGEQLLSTQYDTVSLNSMNEAPSEVRTLDVRDVANNFGAVKDVSSGLFSSFDDQMKEQGPSDNLDESSVEETLEEIQEEKAAEEAAAEDAVIDDVAVEGEKGEKKIELKTMKSEKKADIAEKQADRQEAKEKITEFRENNEIDDAIDVRLLATIGDIGLKFKVGGDVDENAVSGTDVGHIVTTDDLPFDLTYSLTKDGGGLFTIDPTTGVVTLTGTAPDFESAVQTFYNIRVQATRSDTGATKEFDLRVDLNDVNESAEISGNTTIIPLNEVESGLAADTVVTDLNFAETDNAGSGFRTQFTTDDARFEVQMNAGQLQLVALTGASFDFETESNITVSITQNDGANSYTNYDVTVPIYDLIDEMPTDISVDSNNVDENIANETVVATLSTTDADASDTFTYAILSGNDDNIFKIDGDKIKINDNTKLDHEYDDGHDLDIQVTDSNGHTYNETITINVDNVNEPATIQFALKDIYSITDMNALLPIGVDGATIGQIIIDDPDGHAFNASDFNLIGNASSSGGGSVPLSDLFEVKDVSGDFYLSLKAGHTLVFTGGFYKINDGSETHTLGNSNNYDFKFTLSGDTSELKTLTVGFGNTTTEGITLGDATDNEFTANNDDFKLIRGGEGYDTLKLNGINGNGALDIFDFRSTISNLVGDSADLKSIEEIQISYQSGDSENTLKMNIADVLDLLKTSENGELKFSSVNVSGVDSKVEFYDGSTKETLTANGFTNNGDSDSDGFYEFTHSTFGTVLIEDTIIGAAGGGSI